MAEAQARVCAAGALVSNDPRRSAAQRYYTKQAEAKTHTALKAALDEKQVQLLHSGGGTGAALLQPPRRPEHLLSDDEFAVALRRRLLLKKN